MRETSIERQQMIAGKLPERMAKEVEAILSSISTDTIGISVASTNGKELISRYAGVEEFNIPLARDQLIEAMCSQAGHQADEELNMIIANELDKFIEVTTDALKRMALIAKLSRG